MSGGISLHKGAGMGHGVPDNACLGDQIIPPIGKKRAHTPVALHGHRQPLTGDQIGVFEIPSRTRHKLGTEIAGRDKATVKISDTQAVGDITQQSALEKRLITLRGSVGEEARRILPSKGLIGGTGKPPIHHRNNFVCAAQQFMTERTPLKPQVARLEICVGNAGIRR